jgi:SAM-dependent methyltransferase
MTEFVDSLRERDHLYMGAYTDDVAVGNITRDLIAQGHTTFQLFQYGGSERVHADTILTMLNPPRGSRVLSLGCGVGGMESWWLDRRPDLTFELVNRSQAQLDLCVALGRRVCADLHGYVSEFAPFDVVVLAYVLGHVDFECAIDTALANLRVGGRLVILDAFDATPRFRVTLDYNSPLTEQMIDLGRKRGLAPRAFQAGSIPMGVFAQTVCPWVLDEARPGLYILEKLGRPPGTRERRRHDRPKMPKAPPPNE